MDAVVLLSVNPDHLRWATRKENAFDIAFEKQKVQRAKRAAAGLTAEERSEMARGLMAARTPDQRRENGRQGLGKAQEQVICLRNSIRLQRFSRPRSRRPRGREIRLVNLWRRAALPNRCLGRGRSRAATMLAMILAGDPWKWRCGIGNQRQTDRTRRQRRCTRDQAPVSRKGWGSRRRESDDGELSGEERAVVEAGEREVPERRRRAGEAEKYEVVVGGHPFEVTLGEAPRRLCAAGGIPSAAGRSEPVAGGPRGEDHQRQQSNWQLIMQAKEAYENGVRTMMPPEPDWDREFAINPNEAHRQQKIYQGSYGALARSQQERAQMASIHAQGRRIGGFRNTL